nr:adenylate/guanylate cyclase domain-containing protein [Salinarimonas soli]
MPHDAERVGAAIADWLLGPALRLDDGNALLAGLAERLNAAGLPVDRITIAVDALHSEYAGIGRSWTREDGPRVRFFPHGDARMEVYRASPFYHVHRTGEWLVLDLRVEPDERFGIVAELKEGGHQSYLCIPIAFTNGTENGISLASRTPDAFGPRAMTVLRKVVPALAALLEVRTAHKWLDDVLRIYVGDEPHREILGGSIRRGQVSRIRSAMLFADMRGYTRLSSGLQPEETVELLNTFFDCLVPPIEAGGGEVLKYMGDGLLAIFRDRGDDTGGASHAALAAAREANAGVEALNRAGVLPGPIGLGVALHHGEAAYGNVGSGSRLDFTVIGCDVNLASRIGRLNRVLDEPILMSKAFADHLWDIPDELGPHAVEGFDEPVRLYRPRRV